jgi:hypothetical protein
LGVGDENLIEQLPDKPFENVDFGARDRHAFRPVVVD